MKIFRYLLFPVGALLLSACQNNDFDIQEPIIAPIAAENFSGNEQGYDYVWTWPAQNGRDMQVQVLNGTQQVMQTVVAGNSFTHENLESNVKYTYVFKLTDGTNLSTGTVLSHTRFGAQPVSGIVMSQLDNPDGSYDASIQWTPSPDADKVNVSVTSALRNIDVDLDASNTQYIISDVKDGEEINVVIVASNSTGIALPASSSLRIGKTAIGFLSVYPDTDALMAQGDDDEICAWLWLHEEYPSAQYLYFGNITSADDLTPFRVLFWMRDIEMNDVSADIVFDMPEVVMEATPFIRQWYADGGSLLLWSHATAYVGTIGRLSTDMLRSNDRSINVGFGGWNGDTWKMAVELHPGSRFKKDASSHPIFKGLDYETTDRTKLIAFKGPGWTEDHNCLYFNIPSVLTGIGNQEEACYKELTETYGIYPLGTWDSQIDWVSQLNVWEAQQGNTEFKGTILCIGNGGCEFSMRNADGSPDLSAYPKNNPYQGNVLTLAKNSLEYLKTR